MGGEIPKLGRVRLGPTGREIGELGVGTIAWGDPGRGYGSTFEDPMIEVGSCGRIRIKRLIEYSEQ